MSPRLLAIDQGTTSTRAVMFDATAQPLASSQIPLSQIYPRNGWVEHNPEDIWNATLAACREVIAATGGAEGIAAIGITNQRETTLLWDKRSGKPIMNAIVWQDRRGAEMCRKLRADGNEALIQERTGLLADSYFSATKIAWMLENVAGAREAAARGELAFGTVDSFLLWRMTNGRVHATDATNASRTMLYNIHKNRWDADLLALFNIPPGILPTVMDNACHFGSSDAEFFGTSIPITGMVGDQQGAIVGQACFEPGMIKSTYGTGCFLLVNTGAKALASTNRMLTTIAYRLGGQTTYALEGSIFNAGTVVQWMRDGIGIIDTAAETEEIAASLDTLEDYRHVYFVPAFTGLGAPHWDPDARAAILGLTRDSTRAHIVRAALESVCFQTFDLLKALAADGVTTPARLRVDGGMVANSWLLQALANITDLPVERPANRETTVLGAAFLAGLGAGVFSSLEALKAAWCLDFCATPTMPTTSRDALLAGWQEAVGRVRTTSDNG